MGGTAFVSKCFAMHAIEKGYTVDIFTRGRLKVDYLGINEHLIGDRKNTDDLKRLVTKSYDYVVDFSAYFEEDIAKLSEVLDRTNLKRYVFCSTCSVYMAPKEGKVLNEEYPRGMDEYFGGEYGYNKMKAEDYLINSGVPYTIFRPTYIYGEYNYVFRDAYLFDSIERGKVNVLEDKCEVQFVYVRDLAKTFESCFHIEASINQAYNLANPKPINWSTWLDAGFYATGKTADVCVYTDEMLDEAGVRIFPFGNADIKFSIQKLKDHGLYVPDTEFKEGLKSAYEWYKTVDSSVITRGKFELV